MEPTGPVESDIGVATVELDGGTDRPAGGGLIEVAHAPLLRVGSRWERRATMLCSITENSNHSLFSLFFKSRTSDKGKLPPMISTKMNADSFGSEMESELVLEERGYGGIGITDEV